jgi:hypothetical protein
MLVLTGPNWTSNNYSMCDPFMLTCMGGYKDKGS